MSIRFHVCRTKIRVFCFMYSYYNMKTRKNKKTIHRYTKKHYESNNGMMTAIWGPAIWHFLHTMSFNYPVKPTREDKNNYRNFVLSLKNVLPCGKCRKNLCKNLAKHPLLMKHMTSRDTFSKYIYQLHEVVNTMLNKKSGLSYVDVRERYEHFRARCLSTDSPIPNEKGCVDPIYGVKSKCVINIVPQEKKCDTLSVDNRCMAIKTK